MTQEQFENYCNGLVDVNSSSYVLKLIQSNLKILSELKDKQKLLKSESLKLQTDMHKFRDTMHQKFINCLNNNRETFTQNINGYVKKTVLDDNQDVMMFNKAKLLEPLKPNKIDKNEENINQFIDENSK